MTMTARTAPPRSPATLFQAVAPTPIGVIRAVSDQLDALEDDLGAARAALAAAEATLTAATAHQRRPPEALTIGEVADALGLSRSTVAAMISRRELPSVKIGGSRRVLRRDLDAYLAALPGGGAA